MIPRPVLEFSVSTNLKGYKDTEMVLLKGHLILEQLLYSIMSARKVDIDKIQKMNLMFGKMLELSAALNIEFEDNDYVHLKELNRLRNKAAHRIFFDDYHDDLENWAYKVLGCEPKTKGSKVASRNHIIKAFALLSGNLNEMCV